MDNLSTGTLDWPSKHASFIGREQDITFLTNLLQRESVRLITLVGPQGSGKTSLSLQVTEELDHLFTDGINYIMLANMNNPQIILSTISESLKLEQVAPQDLIDQIIEHVQQKHLLLILDTFDQHIENTNIIRDLLDATTDLKILVTNQEPLGIKGEHEYKIFPLTSPTLTQITHVEHLADFSATRLFIERLKAKKPDIEINAANSMAIVQICTHLDGLPLAIELVAAQAQRFDPEALWQQLEPYIGFHTPGARDRSIRQQTLHATLNWVTGLFEDEALTLLPQIALFQSGCTVESYSSICYLPNEKTVPDSLLEQLADSHLLHIEASHTTAPRFYMSDTIRSFVLTQFGHKIDLAATRQRFIEYYLQLAEQSQEGLNSTDQGNWLQRLREEYNNFRTVIQWAMTSQQHESALRICAALWRFWIMRGFIGEGRWWIETILDQAAENVEPIIRATALNRLGSLYSIQGEYTKAQTFFHESLYLQQTHHNPSGAASTLNNLGMAAYQQGAYERAREYFEQCLTIRRELDDPRQIAITSMNLGVMMNEAGHYAYAQAVLEESYDVWAALNDTWGMTVATTNLGEALAYQGYFEEALEMLGKSLMQAQELGDNELAAVTRIILARTQIAVNIYDQASLHLAESLMYLQESGNKLAIADGLETCAQFFVAVQATTTAAHALAAAQMLRTTMGAPIPPSHEQRYNHTLIQIKEQLDQAQFEQAWNGGSTTAIDDLLHDISIKLQDQATRL